MERRPAWNVGEVAWTGRIRRKNLFGMGFQRLSGMDRASNDDGYLSGDTTDKAR